MINEWYIGKDLEGSACGLIEGLSRHSPGVIEEDDEITYFWYSYAGGKPIHTGVFFRKT
jgi:hypothetical protein